jgi:hypothetical protein
MTDQDESRTCRRAAPFAGLDPVLLAVLLALAPACGGHVDGSTNGDTEGASTIVSGTVGGAVVSTNSTIAIVGPLVETFGAFTSSGVTVLASNLADACSVAQGQSNPPGAQTLYLLVGSPGPVVPGTYGISTAPPVAGGNVAAVVYETDDATCSTTSAVAAHAGSITLSTIDSATVGGTFDVIMDTGDELSGTFRAPLCDVSGASDTGPAPECGR